MDIQVWSDVLTAHGPWPAFCLILACGVAFLLRRLAAIQDRAWRTLDENTRALAEFATLLRERLPR